MPARRWNDAHQPVAKPPVAKPRGLPTPRQIEVFLAVIRLTTYQAAADELGIGRSTVRKHMSAVIKAVGATDQANAAYILFDLLHDQMVLPGDQ
jgi:DNA-binding NarL/FixJ family response regulator